MINSITSERARGILKTSLRENGLLTPVSISNLAEIISDLEKANRRIESGIKNVS